MYSLMLFCFIPWFVIDMIFLSCYGQLLLLVSFRVSAIFTLCVYRDRVPVYFRLARGQARGALFKGA